VLGWLGMIRTAASDILASKWKAVREVANSDGKENL
jgi:hypothetical protein